MLFGSLFPSNSKISKHHLEAELSKHRLPERLIWKVQNSWNSSQKTVNKKGMLF